MPGACAAVSMLLPTQSFRDWQPTYAAHGIPTFPVQIGPDLKKPMVSNYGRFGLPASSEIARKFPDATAIGFMVGRRTGLTILDVDTSDERVLVDALALHGPTPIIVRSGSGNYQAWYRHAPGEKRRIRPYGSLPIDILGGGFVVAPPSIGKRGRYEFIQGHLNDLDHLPIMRNAPAIVPDAPVDIEPTFTEERTGSIQKGHRNNALFRYSMRDALRCESFDELLVSARILNRMFQPPLDDDEVKAVAHSAWKMTINGKNRFGAPPTVIVDHRTVDALAARNPDALALLMILERRHASNDNFFLAKAMATSLGWGTRRWRAAREHLVEGGFIRRLQAGGRGPKDPPIFAWPEGGQNDPQ